MSTVELIVSLLMVVQYVQSGDQFEGWKKTGHLFGCKLELSYLCSQMYSRGRKVPSETFKAPTKIKGTDVTVYCKQSNEKVECVIRGDLWFRCVRSVDEEPDVIYSSKHHKSPSEYEGICQAATFYRDHITASVMTEEEKERSKNEIFESGDFGVPTDTSGLKWSKEPELYACYIGLKKSCSARYHSDVRAELLSKPFQTKTNLNEKIVSVDCNENESGLKCTVGGTLWFECQHFREQEVFLRYRKDDHKDVTEYEGICEALSIFSKLMRYNPSGRKGRDYRMGFFLSEYLVPDVDESYYFPNNYDSSVLQKRKMTEGLLSSLLFGQ